MCVSHQQCPAHQGHWQGPFSSCVSAHGRQTAGGGMFLRGGLLLGAFKSFLRGSCLCIRLQLTPSQERGGSERAPETQPPTRAHLHVQGTWGARVGGRAVCVQA